MSDSENDSQNHAGDSGSDEEGIAPPVASLSVTPAQELTFEGGLFKKLYEDRYEEDHGKKLSRSERKREGYISSTLTYGEIRFDTFSELFDIIRSHDLLQPGGTFVDVGCGIGKPVFAAALLHDFKRCVGIEILEDCYRACVDTLGVFTREVKPLLPETRTQPENLQFSFQHNDALLVDWSHASMVFMNSTCFDMALMLNLSVACRSLREGTIIVTTTRKILGKQFELIEERKMEESWGEASVYIFRRMPVS
jgi:SAM-dependent methyltransferase